MAALYGHHTKQLRVFGWTPAAKAGFEVVVFMHGWATAVQDGVQARAVFARDGGHMHMPCTCSHMPCTHAHTCQSHAMRMLTHGMCMCMCMCSICMCMCACATACAPRAHCTCHAKPHDWVRACAHAQPCAHISHRGLRLPCARACARTCARARVHAHAHARALDRRARWRVGGARRRHVRRWRRRSVRR